MRRSNRDNKSQGFDSSNFNVKNKWTFAAREFHKAVCAKCGKECEVPFKPIEGKPVYCRDCYREMKGGR